MIFSLSLPPSLAFSPPPPSGALSPSLHFPSFKLDFKKMTPSGGLRVEYIVSDIPSTPTPW